MGTPKILSQVNEKERIISVFTNFATAKLSSDTKSQLKNGILNPSLSDLINNVSWHSYHLCAYHNAVFFICIILFIKSLPQMPLMIMKRMKFLSKMWFIHKKREEKDNKLKNWSFCRGQRKNIMNGVTKTHQSSNNN